MISTVTDLNERFEALSKSLDDKIKGADGMRHIVLCGGTGCLSAHSTEIMERFKELLKEKGIENKATVNQVGCFGFCSQGPFVKIYPEDTLYKMVKIEDVDEIVERLLYVDPKTQEKAFVVWVLTIFDHCRRIFGDKWRSCGQVSLGIGRAHV